VSKNGVFDGKNMGTSLENMGKTSRNIMARDGKHIGESSKNMRKIAKTSLYMQVLIGTSSN